MVLGPALYLTDAEPAGAAVYKKGVEAMSRRRRALRGDRGARATRRREAARDSWATAAVMAAVSGGVRAVVAWLLSLLGVDF
ncbi:hypothetical protein JIX56_19565 [Streptomyces sp. CA-210063]|uniref:hypothetical protein n=1 Tax=Streptomyces sp. CA-210063 TaxID=2801029 RepID=UPI00214AE30B|nr:hypothetical protein [Streptomyces sp. CA-210063]UUU31920.1 hypothetical protein JIX56_19565 [Streptomyces sp. CA-210063]